MPTPREHLLAEIQDRLGYQRRGLAWAKVEILLGLFASSIGLLLGVAGVVNPGSEYTWAQTALGVLLMPLGGYLTLAGHRSHLYRCATEQTSLLVEEIRRLDNDTHVSPQRR